MNSNNNSNNKINPVLYMAWPIWLLENVIEFLIEWLDVQMSINSSIDSVFYFVSSLMVYYTTENRNDIL